MNFSLDMLEALEAIDRAGSFAGAARALHKSTPAVSYAVRALEDALDVDLFDRSGHRAVLTPAGRQVLAEARRVLDRARDLDRLARQLRDEWEAELTVAVDGVLPTGPVMHAVRQLTEQGAPTRIRVQVEYLTGVHRCFDEGADLMLALDVREDPGLHLRELPAVELVLLAHRDHPLHALGRTLDRGDLAEHVELVVADSGERPERPRHRLWLGSPHVFQVGDFPTKLEAVRDRVGFGWIPLHLCADELAAGVLVPLPFDEGSRHRMIPHLVERSGRVRGRAAGVFLAALAEHLGRAPRPRAPTSEG